MTTPLARRVCRGCGCTDNRACRGGCTWVLLDVDSPSGICSTCAETFQWHPALLATIGFDDEAAGELLGALGYEVDYARRKVSSPAEVGR